MEEGQKRKNPRVICPHAQAVPLAVAGGEPLSCPTLRGARREHNAYRRAAHSDMSWVAPSSAAAAKSRELSCNSLGPSGVLS